MEKLSIYGGTGFIGSTYASMYPNEVSIVPRDDYIDLSPGEHPEVLYMISTTDNYNIKDYPTLDIETNLIRLIKTLDLNKHKFKTVNFVSSWFVYGTPQHYCGVNELDPCDPQGFYSITKRTAEQMLISWCKTHDINYRILRLSNVIGPGDRKVSPKKNALTYLIHEMAANRPIKLYHDGNFVRDYIHVKDVCRGIKTVLERGELNSIYNIGSGHPWRFRSLIDYAKERLNSTSEIERMDATKFHKIVQTKDFWFDTTKLETLGFECIYTPYDAIDEIVQKIPNR